MNVLLWILQSALALLYLSGGAYKLFKGDELVDQISLLSPGAWGAFGALEVVGAILLIVPAAASWMPGLTLLAASVLTVETLILAGIYGRDSLALSVSNPLVWAVFMGLVAAFVAYGRYALSPLS